MDPDAHERRALALERQRQAQSRHTATLVKDFAVQAQAAGLPVTRLTARAYGAGTRYRTQVDGWYLKRDRSVGIGVDGNFYILSVPRSLSSRLAGVTIPPSDAPVELGRGGRDGESVPLTQALASRLTAGPDEYL